MENQDTGINPKAKVTLAAETSKPVMTRSKRFFKLKPRNQVKEKVSKESMVILETPQPTKENIAEIKEMTQEQSANKPVQRKLTKSQIA